MLEILDSIFDTIHGGIVDFVSLGMSALITLSTSIALLLIFGFWYAKTDLCGNKCAWRCLIKPLFIVFMYILAGVCVICTNFICKWELDVNTLVIYASVIALIELWGAAILYRFVLIPIMCIICKCAHGKDKKPKVHIHNKTKKVKAKKVRKTDVVENVINDDIKTEVSILTRVWLQKHLQNDANKSRVEILMHNRKEYIDYIEENIASKCDNAHTVAIQSYNNYVLIWS